MSRLSEEAKDRIKREMDSQLIKLSKMEGVRSVDGCVEFSDGVHTRVGAFVDFGDGNPFTVRSHSHQQ